MARWITRTLPYWDQLVCPECHYDLEIRKEDIREGDVLSCVDCGSQFEVMSLSFELARIGHHRKSGSKQKCAA